MNNNQYPPNQPGSMPPMPPMPGHGPQPGHGLGIASMVLGIVAMVAALGFFYIPVAPQLVAITGIVLGFVAKNQGNKGSQATAGIILSIIALALGLIAFVACMTCFAWALMPWNWFW